MAIKLIIDDTEVGLNKGSYKEYPTVVENRSTTEAGTTVRDIVRTGAGHLEVSMNADETEKAFFDDCVNASALTVQYWSESSGALTTKTMYMDPGSYSAELLVENTSHRYYSISFTLEEF